MFTGAPKKAVFEGPGKSVRGEPARNELDGTQSQTWPEKEAGERGMWLWQREGFGEP